MGSNWCPSVLGFLHRVTGLLSSQEFETILIRIRPVQKINLDRNPAGSRSEFYIQGCGSGFRSEFIYRVVDPDSDLSFIYRVVDPDSDLSLYTGLWIRIQI